MPRPSIPSGYTPLKSLADFNENNHGFWKTTAAALRDAVIEAYRTRTEVIGSANGLAAGASLAADALHLDFSGWQATSMLNQGQGFGLLPDGADLDVLTAGAAVLQPIYPDGSDASGVTLGAGEAARISLIIADSDGAGGAVTDPEAGLKVLLIVDQPSTTPEDAPPGSGTIQAALEAATGVHDGTTAWSWLGHLLWEDTPAITFVDNTNNHLGL